MLQARSKRNGLAWVCGHHSVGRFNDSININININMLNRGKMAQRKMIFDKHGREQQLNMNNAKQCPNAFPNALSRMLPE